ncbi:YhcH/YjgK/YiaL family protein [Clostridium sp. 19966]|uniref:YhcH/YjgK/YiaL family protein n=1 Tax=Clostridium sp. 19966 TaxID=2768166 RepID=UPI0028DE9073|nr:YhcH/YjgK/YiaL family protein [Clostridium sp. 19966]MDT8717956.1 YhcH/YjgK/YiaL family protein [Clostridium sp. 19966]
MIVDKLNNAELYYGVNPSIKTALKYLKEKDLKSLQPGKYPIDGDKIYISISEYVTKPEEDCKWEAHKKYIDIQYIIAETEKMGYTHISNLKVTEEYDEGKDVLFGEAAGDIVTVREGSFAIFFPEDAHMPCIRDKENQCVKKAVAKIFIE